MNLLYLLAGLFLGATYHAQVAPAFGLVFRAVVRYAAAHQGAPSI